MRQFGTIFKFELMNYFKNKIFVGVTIAFVVLIGLVMFFPSLKGLVEEGSPSENPEDEKSVMLLLNESSEEGFNVYYDSLKAGFTEVFQDYEVRDYKDGLKKAKKQITSGKAECAFVIKSATEYTYYVDNLSMYDMNTEIADELMSGQYQITAMEQAGLSAADAQIILGTLIDHKITSLGKDQEQNFFYTYIMLFALYMVILMYGQMIATNVASEKSSRAMELLITSAKPVSMMFGKVIASCIAGLVQIVAIFGSAILFYNINQEGWEDNAIIQSIFDMPESLFIYMLVFFVLGFFIYAFMYGAIGSMASKLEDINTSVMPITMIFLVAFMVVMYSMGNGSVDNLLMQICSYVPFTSPMAMFTRIAMSTVPAGQIAISIILLVASVVGVGVLSAKIYRMGVLMYGKAPKIGEMLKNLK